MPPGSRRAEIALLLASVVAALLVAEAAVRLFNGADAASGYAPVRTGRRDRQPINALGYRDLERVQPKPSGVRRLVCLGDSFTWGVGVLFDDALAAAGRADALAHARRTLGGRQPGGARDERGPAGEPARRARASAYGPDVVVMAYVLNDSEDEDAAEARRAQDWAEDERREADPAFASRSALLRLVRTRVHATVENRRRITGYRSMYGDGYAGWVKARQALVTMGGLCRARGVPFVVVIFPLFANPLDAGYPFAELHAKVAQAAGEAGAKVVDLLPSYRRVDWRLLVVDGAADEHPNEIAHRIAAQAIVRSIDDVVPRPAPPARAAP